MYFKTLVLCLLFATSVFGANIPSATSVFISGGSVNTATQQISIPPTSTNLGTRVGLVTGSSSASAGNQHFSFSSTTQSATGCYTPTNTLYCTSLTVAASVANTQFSLGYGTSCVYNTAAPTGPIYYAQSATNYLFANFNATASVPATIPIFAKFPSGKVPFVVGTWGAAQSFSITLDCIEL